MSNPRKKPVNRFIDDALEMGLDRPQTAEESSASYARCRRPKRDNESRRISPEGGTDRSHMSILF